MDAWFDWTTWWENTQAFAGSGTVVLIGVFLVLLAIASWATNAVSMPGNWGIVLIAAIAAVFIPSRFGEPQTSTIDEVTMLMDWPTVVVLLLLAGLGEALEMIAGAAGAAKKGASRRSVALSLVGAMAGSIAGAMAGVPIAVVGSLIAAVLGGAIGAFGGAYLGEYWKGVATHEDRVAIGSAAFTGKIAGTAAKILVGAVMCAVFAVSLVV